MNHPNKKILISAFSFVAIFFGVSSTFATINIIDSGTCTEAACSITTEEKVSPCGSFGDVTDDGKISSADYTFLYDNMEGFELDDRGDVNGNGIIDFDDVVLINSYLKGDITTFPACKAEDASIVGEDGKIAPYKADKASCTSSSGNVYPTTGEGYANWFLWGGCTKDKYYTVTSGEKINLEVKTDSCASCVCYHPKFNLYELSSSGKWELKEEYDLPAQKGYTKEISYTPESSNIKIEALSCFYLDIYEVAEEEVTPIAQCTDSDGKNYFKKGSIYDTGHPGTFDNDDRCTTGTKLLEYTCKNDAWYATYYECEYGCVDGACLKEEPEKNDAEYDISGSFTKTNFEYVSNSNKIFGNIAVDGKTYFADLDGDKDETFTYTNRYCGYDSNYHDYSDGWSIVREYISADEYKIMVKGRSKPDCGLGQPQNTGWFEINPDSDWEIAETVKCNITQDNGSNGIIIDTYCTVDKDSGEVKWQSGSMCGGCCACGDGAGVDIEVIVKKTGSSDNNSDDDIDDNDSEEDLGEGELIQTPSDPKVYVIKNRKKYWIRNASEFERLGYKWSDIKTISSEKISDIEEDNSHIGEDDTILILSSKDKRVYRLVNGKMIWVPTVAAFNAQGLKWEEVAEDSDALSQYEESRLVKDSEGNIYYITNSGKKKLIINMEVFYSYKNDPEDVVEVSEEVLDSMEDIELVRGSNDYKIYKIENGKKRWVKNIKAFQRLSLKWEDVDTVNETEIEAYEDAQDIE